MTHHTSITAMLVLTGAGLLGLFIEDTSEASVEPLAATITYVDEPSDHDRALVDWAVERYLEAGLQLPDLQISFPAACGGKAGRYHVGRGLVELCSPTRPLVLHEFAHAWDDYSPVDRKAFLERRGLDHWYEQPGVRSGDSGGEQLAHIIAWGLMDVDITARNPDRADQPIDEQPRYLPGMDDSSPEILQELFVQLTGSIPLTPVPSSGPEVALHDVDPRWASTIDDHLSRFENAGLGAPIVDIHVWARQPAPSDAMTLLDTSASRPPEPESTSASTTATPTSVLTYATSWCYTNWPTPGSTPTSAMPPAPST